MLWCLMRAQLPCVKATVGFRCFKYCCRCLMRDQSWNHPRWVGSDELLHRMYIPFLPHSFLISIYTLSYHSSQSHTYVGSSGSEDWFNIQGGSGYSIGGSITWMRLFQSSGGKDSASYGQHSAGMVTCGAILCHPVSLSLIAALPAAGWLIKFGNYIFRSFSGRVAILASGAPRCYLTGLICWARGCVSDTENFTNCPPPLLGIKVSVSGIVVV
jgi:hypothetical protein